MMQKHIQKNNILLILTINILIIIFFSKLSFAQTISNGLNVIAAAEDVIAIPGNKLPIYIIVSVLDHNGQPITKLNISHFKLNIIIAAPGGSSLMNIIRVIETNIEGTYLLYAIPHEQETWKNGVYIFSISVMKDKFRGQTLVNVLVD
jgi:hypothetical protein